MGHYYGEMMCVGCGQIRCTCTRDPVKIDGWYVHPLNYTIMTGQEYKEKFGTIAYHMDTKHETPAAAGKTAAKMVQADIKATTKRLKELNAIKDKKPWKT